MNYERGDLVRVADKNSAGVIINTKVVLDELLCEIKFPNKINDGWYASVDLEKIE